MLSINPCSICVGGGDPVVLSDIIDPILYQVRCETCFCTGPSCNNEDEAIAHWNNLHKKEE